MMDDDAGTQSPQTAQAKPSSQPRPRRDDKLSRGTLLGRYIVVDELGAGGMGVGYAAYDPELNRRVAVKVLQADSDEGRMLREAQALARLAHPNVVAVYDVGSFGKQMFLAMELVEGQTLSKYLRDGEHAWRDVLALFVQAGRGLVAAHAAGVVHRDFKPGNVLVGADGRVRVMDFGLARAGEIEVPEPAIASSRDMLSEDLTRTGSIMGTPLYMPPEAFRGEVTGELGDQFSFCVALYQALYKQTPFDTEWAGTDEARWKMREPPRGSDVPRWLREVIARGLAVAPADRHRDMQSVIELIDHKPSGARWRVAGAAALGLAVLGVIGYTRFSAHEGRPAVCRGADAKLAGIWDAATKTAIHERFANSGSPLAGDAWGSTERLLDQYTHHWVAMRTETCEATQVRGEQTAEVMTLRMTCLDQRLQELAALVGVLREADDKVVAKAPIALGSLARVDGCADVAALLAPVPPPKDPTKQHEIDEIRAVRAKSAALRMAGKWDEALALGEPLVARAKAIGYRPLEASVLRNVAMLQAYKGESKSAKETALASLEAAEAGRDDNEKVSTLADLASILTDLGEPQAALQWGRIGRSVLEHFHDPDAEIGLLINLGTVYPILNDVESCIESQTEALRLQTRLDPNDIQIIPASINLAKCELLADRLDQASAHLEQAKRALSVLFPSGTHPYMVPIEMNLADIEQARGKFPDAIEHNRRSGDIAAASGGKDHPDAVAARTRVAYQYVYMGEYDKAQEILVPELDAARKRPNFDLNTSPLLSALAETRFGRQELAEAESLTREMIALDKKLMGTADIEEGDYLILAEILSARGRTSEALQELDRAEAVENKLTTGTPDRCRRLVALGTAQLAAKDPRAPATFEAAVAAADGHHVAPFYRARARFALAQLVTDPARAKDLARKARDEFAAAYARGAKWLPLVDAWLAAH